MYQEKRGVHAAPPPFNGVFKATIERTWGLLFRCRYSYIEGRGYKLAYI
jgi:hypothetical protein